MNIEGLLITPTKIISTIGGDVFHAMKKSDLGYAGFGEAYFSTIEPNAIKAWKCHREMVLNILVPIGEVKFILYDDRPKSKTNGNFLEVVLSQKNYQRLTVPPMIWMGFQGMSNDVSMLFNLASIVHNPNEVKSKTLHEINYSWD